MICYKDMAFCSDYGILCYNHSCPRALTNEEIDKAIEWWGDPEEGAPICFSSFISTCTDVKEKDEKVAHESNAYCS